MRSCSTSLRGRQHDGLRWVNPYLITGPALISFSGGRTSGYMLNEIVQAHGGALPDDVVVAFANTGKEREETLRFVHDCGSRWGVKVNWLEWRPMPERFAVVDYNSAARSGEPFEGLIARRGRLPNPLQRFCSRELKVEPIKAFCLSLGWDRWSNVIGLRYDEGMRVIRKLAENDNGRLRWTSAMPLSKGKATRADVMAFWAGQDFDLQLRPHEGNCDLCFLKSVGNLLSIMRDNPQAAGWWITQEAGGKRFERARGYADLEREVQTQPFVPGLLDDEEYDVECGLTCGGGQHDHSRGNPRRERSTARVCVRSSPTPA